MNFKRKFLIFLFGVLIFSCFFLARKNFYQERVFAQGTLSCTVLNSACGGDYPVEIFQMSNTSNAHAALAGQNYSWRVCCGGIEGLGADCNASNKAVVLKLSGQRNAHARQSGYPDYPGSNNVCISAPSGYNISVNYRSGSCESGEVAIASMARATNSHVGGPNAYNTKICVAIGVQPVVSVSVSDGNVDYGIMPANTSKSTIDLNDMQTVTNDGSVTENFNIKGQDATGGGCTWTLASTNGVDQYVHQFCNATDYDCSNPPTNYVALTTTYQTLKTGIPPNGTVQIHLRLTTPTDSSCYGQQSVNVTIQAVQP